MELGPDEQTNLSDVRLSWSPPVKEILTPSKGACNAEITRVSIEAKLIHSPTVNCRTGVGLTDAHS